MAHLGKVVVLGGDALRALLGDFDVVAVGSDAEVEAFAGADVPLVVNCTERACGQRLQHLVDFLDSRMPVLAITSDDAADIARAFNSGVDDVARISGLTAEELRGRLLSLVRHHRLRQSWEALRGRLSRDERIDQESGLLTWAGASEYVERDLSWARRYGRSVALLFIVVDPSSPDIACDADVLSQIAKFLRSSVRETDMLARYEHCEFVLIAPETDDTEAVAIGRRVLAVKERVSSSDRFRVSVGIACSSAVDVASAADLLRLATSAVERARRGGGDRVESLCGDFHR